MIFVGMEILHKRFAILVFTAAHTSLTADLVAFLAVHVCATAHITKIGVLEFCLGGLAKRAGPRRENSTFSDLEDKSPREGVCD